MRDGYQASDGRKKERTGTAGGRRGSAAQPEESISAKPRVDQVIVLGEQKQVIAALVTLDAEMLPVWLNNNGEDANMPIEEAAQHPKVVAEIHRAVDAANTTVSRAEPIRKFALPTMDLTEASGHPPPKLSNNPHALTPACPAAPPPTSPAPPPPTAPPHH